MTEQILNRIADQFGPVNLVLGGVCWMLYRSLLMERAARERDRMLLSKTVLTMSKDFREAIHQFLIR